MSKIIAVSTGKGGGGKSTTAWHIGAGLQQLGQNVLLVDLDQQQHLTKWLGFLDSDHVGKPTISELIYQEVSGVKSVDFGAFICHSDNDNVDYIPANKMLAGILSILGADPQSNEVLNRVLRNPYFEKYNYIILDCPPSFDLWVSNAFKCCDKLLVPVQADVACYEGIPDILEKLSMAKQQRNITQYIQGFLVTMYFKQAIISNKVLNAAKESYGDLVFTTPVPFLQEVKKCTELRTSLISQKNSKAGKSYLEAAKKILGGGEKNVAC